MSTKYFEEIEIISRENTKYREEVEIICIDDFDIQEITAYITINVNRNKLKCFISDFREEGPFFIGEKCGALLSLMTFELNKTKKIKKEINGMGIDCNLSGEIVEFVPDSKYCYDIKTDSYYTIENNSYKIAIVDCGIFVSVEVPKYSDLKVDDYIKAKGRMDIRKFRVCIIINVKGHELKCFINDFLEKYLVFYGKKCTVMLSLIPTELLSKSEISKKDIQKQGYEICCTGKIVEFIPLIETYYDAKKGYCTKEAPNNKYGIVDCGIFIAVEMSKYSELKVGDYIMSIGRLCVQSVEH